MFSYSQLDSIGFELVYVHPNEVIIDDLAGDMNLNGYNTWVLYAYLQNPDDFLTSFIGESMFPSSIAFSEGSSVFQHPAGSAIGPANDAILPFAPLLEYDSFLTIGSVYSSDLESSQIFYVENPEYPWLEPFENGGNIELISDPGVSVFTLYPDENGYAGDDLKVALGQFTTNGNISAELCIQVFVNGDQNNNIINCQESSDAIIEFELPQIEGDLNNDGELTSADIPEFLVQYGQFGNNLSADLNGDGMVSSADLLYLLSIVSD